MFDRTFPPFCKHNSFVPLKLVFFAMQCNCQLFSPAFALKCIPPTMLTMSLASRLQFTSDTSCLAFATFLSPMQLLTSQLLNYAMLLSHLLSQGVLCSPALLANDSLSAFTNVFYLSGC
jgi:hypothetical protein